MSNRGFVRARLIVGGLLLFGAIVSWFMGMMMSPHGEGGNASASFVRGTIVAFIRKSAIGNLVLCGLGGWLLFPSRRPRWPARDWTLIGIIAVIAGTSLYQLFWLRSVAG